MNEEAEMLVLSPLVKGLCQNRTGLERLAVKRWQQCWWQLLQTFSFLEVCNPVDQKAFGRNT